MENALLTERGSAGIEMVLWSFMALVLVMMPLICFIFEVYFYGVHSLKWINATDNALDALEWKLETNELSEARERILENQIQADLEAYLRTMKTPTSGEVYQIKVCEFTESTPPCLALQLEVGYDPSTFVGELVATAGKLRFQILRERELPCDR
jgi:hypothetical protein